MDTCMRASASSYPTRCMTCLRCAAFSTQCYFPARQAQACRRPSSPCDRRCAPGSQRQFLRGGQWHNCLGRRMPPRSRQQVRRRRLLLCKQGTRARRGAHRRRAARWRARARSWARRSRRGGAAPGGTPPWTAPGRAAAPAAPGCCPGAGLRCQVKTWESTLEQGPPALRRTICHTAVGICSALCSTHAPKTDIVDGHMSCSRISANNATFKTRWQAAGAPEWMRLSTSIICSMVWLPSRASLCYP